MNTQTSLHTRRFFRPSRRTSTSHVNRRGQRTIIILRLFVVVFIRQPQPENIIQNAYTFVSYERANNILYYRAFIVIGGTRCRITYTNTTPVYPDGLVMPERCTPSTSAYTNRTRCTRSFAIRRVIGKWDRLDGTSRLRWSFYSHVTDFRPPESIKIAYIHRRTARCSWPTRRVLRFSRERASAADTSFGRNGARRLPDVLVLSRSPARPAYVSFITLSRRLPVRRRRS